MDKNTPSGIVDDVRGVLDKFKINDKDTGVSEGVYLTAHQILNRLPEETKNALVGKYGHGGKQDIPGKYYSAVSAVSDAAEMLVREKTAETVKWLSTDGLATGNAESGSGVCAIYRVK